MLSVGLTCRLPAWLCLRTCFISVVLGAGDWGTGLSLMVGWFLMFSSSVSLCGAASVI